MTAPQQRLCQAPGCGQPIPAERSHPDTKTCSPKCGKDHRNATQTRPERRKRKDAHLQAATRRRLARAAEAACASGWQGALCDHYLRFSCSGSLKRRFDESIPEGETSASWLREILTTLMRSEGPGTRELNERVAAAPSGAPEDAVAHGQYALRSRISSFLWAAICQRAKKENAPDPTSWLRMVVYRAVLDTDWRPQPDPPPDPQPDLAVPNFYEWYDEEEATRRTIEFIDRAKQPIQERCQPMIPAGAPRPRNLEEWKAVDKMTLLGSIWEQWSAASPKGVRTLWKLGQLYQEMHKAEQAYARVRANLLRREEDAKAHKRAEQDCLLWESKEELDRLLQAAARKPA